MPRQPLLLTLALTLLCVAATSARAADFRVCTDPDYMPFSNRAGEGFENKVAELVARELGERLVYTWASYRQHGGFSEFLARNLDSGKCDAVMDIPYGNQDELTTDPYYASSYVFVSKKARNYDLESMDSPILRKVKIGFERDTPPEDGLKIRDLIIDATPFSVGDQEGVSPASMLQAVEDGKIDVMITWEPAIGYFLKNYPDLTVARVPNERVTGSPEQYMFSMAMGVRKNDQALAKKLNAVIARHKRALQDILRRYNVRLYPVEGEAL
ncbi:MAG TPA: quinoprotein dehydrogenase-associated putative ABC transporter substrate-binding protein [Candidatus Binataceae bacterium]|nr:quinoprotein dehydrogenase-associated putative ABC transporter substrate-binding protein [Candidatus Binataceae bacterium]